MRKIIVTTFSTMDGVLQAPGGPDEDKTGGFTWGGWQFGYSDALVNEAIGKIMEPPFELLLGHRTYEIFSAYWPYNNDNPIGEKFNRIKKYVVASTPVNTSWNNSVVISKDVVSTLKKLKQEDGPDLLVHGSSRLAQTLLANRLVDVLHLWIYPITLGKGKKFFQEGTVAQEWKLTNHVVTSTGAFLATYEAGGAVKHGSFITDKPSEAELERRKRWAEKDHS